MEQNIEGTFTGKNETITNRRLLRWRRRGTRCASCPPLRESTPTRPPAPSRRRRPRAASPSPRPRATTTGPVRVANKYHFAYEDGVPYYSVGTTCYVWPHQPRRGHPEDPGGAGQGLFQQDALLRVPQALHPQLQGPPDLPLRGRPGGRLWPDRGEFLLQRGL